MLDPRGLTPAEAVEGLEASHAEACASLRACLRRFSSGGEPPSQSERTGFTYPEIRVSWSGDHTPLRHSARRAWARMPGAGIYSTTVTQPGIFRAYLLEQLEPLVSEYGATLSICASAQEIPYQYVRGVDLGRIRTAADFARHFPVPMLARFGDDIVDGLHETAAGANRPLSLFDAARTDYSLNRLAHYTGTPSATVQPWILLTNYKRYIRRFIQHGIDKLLAGGSRYDGLVLPGGIVLRPDMDKAEAEALGDSVQWSDYQMPACSLTSPDRDGVTIVDIGVGPSNAKTMTDHLAVLRPHMWLMLGHCGGLRQDQSIGDYVLAHAYLRRDKILDDVLPPDIPIPALAEVQKALARAAEDVTGESGDRLKARMRTGTVITHCDRNWELRYAQERRGINLARAVGIDMESGTIAAQGYRMRVPYGTLLCVSDKPLHGEIKLPGAAAEFYQRAVGEHFAIGLAAVDIMRGQVGELHSRKLRSFDEPVFR